MNLPGRVLPVGFAMDVDIRSDFTPGTRRNVGKHDEVEVIVGEGPVAAGQALASYAQHRVCLAAKRHLDQHGTSITGLAEALYQHPATLQRKFRGEESASMAELLSWCYALGLMPVWTGLWAEIANGKYPKVSNRAAWDVEPLTGLRARPLPPERGTNA